MIGSTGYARRADHHVVVEPLDNSMVVFPSGFHHEVRPVRSAGSCIDAARITVNGWWRRSRTAPVTSV